MLKYKYNWIETDGNAFQAAEMLRAAISAFLIIIYNHKNCHAVLCKLDGDNDH